MKDVCGDCFTISQESAMEDLKWNARSLGYTLGRNVD